MQMTAAPACMKGQLDIAVISTFGKDLFHVGFLFICLRRLEMIEFPQLLPKRALLFHDLGITDIKYKTVDHSLILCHLLIRLSFFRLSDCSPKCGAAEEPKMIKSYSSLYEFLITKCSWHRVHSKSFAV